MGRCPQRRHWAQMPTPCAMVQPPAPVVHSHASLCCVDRIFRKREVYPGQHMTLVRKTPGRGLWCQLGLPSAWTPGDRVPGKDSISWAEFCIFLVPLWLSLLTQLPHRTLSLQWAQRGSTEGSEGEGNRGHQLGPGLCYDGSSARIMKGPFSLKRN